MKDLDDIINEITDTEKLAKKEAKFIYDFCLSLIVNQSDKDFLRLTDKQAKEIAVWLRDFVLPIYEDFEDYEKCKKVKSTIDRIKHLKKIP